MKVLITRPEPDASAMAALLKNKGIESHIVPLLEVVIPAQAGIQEDDSILIFVSKNAALAYPNVGTDRVCFAMGEGTAQILKERGFSNILYPHHSEGSESLLALPEFQEIEGLPLTIVRGSETRQLLEHSLKERGAVVKACIVYESRARALIKPEIKSLKDPYDLIVTTSSNALRYLALLAIEHRLKIMDTPITVLSGNMLQSALSLGFTKPMIVKSLQNEAIAMAL